MSFYIFSAIGFWFGCGVVRGFFFHKGYPFFSIMIGLLVSSIWPVAVLIFIMDKDLRVVE